MMRKTGWYWVKHLGYLIVNIYRAPNDNSDCRYKWSGWDNGFTDDDYSWISDEPIEPPNNVG